MTLWLVLIVFAGLIAAAAVAGKHRTVKAIDVAGLNFLSPVVRLCYGEEPRKQLQDIGRYIVVPLVAVAAFIIAWFAVAERVQTKSGKLPNPTETWRSASAILEFHHRENDKQRAFNLDGKDRKTALTRVEARLAELAPLEEQANDAVAEAKANAAGRIGKKVAALQEEHDTLAKKYKAAQQQRDAELEAAAAAAVTGDKAEKDAYVAMLRDHRTATKAEKFRLRELKSAITTQQAERDPAVAAALAHQTIIAEERLYLVKMQDQLTGANRHTKVATENEKLEAAKAALYAADVDGIKRAATNVVRTEDRIEMIEESGYAKPATLPYQVARSVLCVFFGFVIGSALAIPLGVLCGLSKTFMAAMTPFIAIFKPVSPIVWLPVALIVVSGFMPDPDKHWLTQWMWSLPWIGDYKINPAFIASAITVALCSLWATMVNTAFGVASVDKDHLNVARVLRLGFWDRLFKIVLPSSLPLVFAGLRISLGVGWMVLIAAELLSSSEGLGKFVWDQFNNGASDSFAKMMVVVFVVGAIGLLLDRMMVVFQRLVSFDGAPTAI
ncbi:ABC transporter permease [Botrimarina mediterranea]|uniref:Bicarbonate transport system permease protein CmpB n=1 Tax=Botrimarina mediterranea TaxID=2528022 RepID=A0A518K813_9BACT|nr:ABC transporter permease [Botrimarina mediterranea]QDV73932.1 Bicarbonate transport system permease protein CmpB [Botrimarina mediterranea]QDV78562.1 Bicarbonate transport system permease protein CmpB [Planctomycetes bacterium K2D]